MSRQAFLDWLEALLALGEVKAGLPPEALARLEREARGARTEMLGPGRHVASSRLTHRKRDSMDALLCDTHAATEPMRSRARAAAT